MPHLLCPQRYGNHAEGKDNTFFLNFAEFDRVQPELYEKTLVVCKDTLEGIAYGEEANMGEMYSGATWLPDSTCRELWLYAATHGFANGAAAPRTLCSARTKHNATPCHLRTELAYQLSKDCSKEGATRDGPRVPHPGTADGWAVRCCSWPSVARAPVTPGAWLP